MPILFDPLREAEELREQLASDKRRVVFLFGAGTSQAVGLDGMPQLTKNVGQDLTGKFKGHYERLLSVSGTNATVEAVLNRVRLCRELIGAEATTEVMGFKGIEAAETDREICKAIYGRLKVDPPRGMATHVNFASWLSSIQWLYPIEIFTTNYDLFLERAMEIAEVPYFDGFVGTVSPYFSDTTVEFDDQGRLVATAPPRSWARIWKLHGSINWRAVVEPHTGMKRVIRLLASELGSDAELMIFPSKEKYTDSRKLPFVALQDRFRKVLSAGECLLVVAGYSFGDEHINEIIFRSLRGNNRLAVTVLSYDGLSGADLERNLLRPTIGARNITVYAPDGARVAGNVGEWSVPTGKLPAGIEKWPFWNETKKYFSLGDFRCFSDYLMAFFGVRKSLMPSGEDAPPSGAERSAKP